ncbi:MAG: ABC transporter substrate-binding protein [Chloroflexi bacterium]|nr:ABC transporter substrate-binding protein [Chloroflexota bacterium]
MKRPSSVIAIALAALGMSFLAVACGATPTPEVRTIEKVVTQVVEKPIEKVVTQVVEKSVEVTKVVEKEKVVEKLVTPVPPTQKIVKVGTYFPDGFNPFLVTGPRSVKGLLFNALVKLDVNQNVVGDLAEKWEISSDAKVFTFVLRKGVKWHDGQPFTAKDVEFTFRRHVDKRTNSAWTPPFLSIKGATAFNQGDEKALADDKVEGIQVVDDATVRFTLEAPSASFLASLTEIPILPVHILGMVKPDEIDKSPFATGAPIGTGPFKFVSWKADEFVELVRNNDYFKGAPKLDKIFVTRVEYEPAKVMLERGEIDLLTIQGADADSILSKPNLKLIPVAATTYFVLNWCVGEPCKTPVAPKELRQALVYAVDRTAIDKVRQAGRGKVINTMSMPSWVQESCQLPNDYKFDPNKAKELLKKINWDPNKELVLMHSGGWREKAAEAMQQMWANVGVKVKIDKIESAVDRQRIRDGTYSIRIDWPEQGADPDFTSIYFGEFYPTGNNQPRYRNKELDDLFVKGRQTVNQAERQKIYCRIQQIINEDLPWAPLFTYAILPVVNSRVTGVEIGHDIDYGWDLWRNVEKWDVTK